MMGDKSRIIGMIDHAVLAPDATRDDVLAACELCAELGTASVCIHPRWVEVAVDEERVFATIEQAVRGIEEGG